MNYRKKKFKIQSKNAMIEKIILQAILTIKSRKSDMLRKEAEIGTGFFTDSQRELHRQDIREAGRTDAYQINTYYEFLTGERANDIETAIDYFDNYILAYS